MTTLIAGMQNSVLVLESLMSGWKTQATLKGIISQNIVFDH
ncbi:MAG TPA: hypothetical protein VIS28_02865 [Nitrososphaeraceae archaeon]